MVLMVCTSVNQCAQCIKILCTSVRSVTKMLCTRVQSVPKCCVPECEVHQNVVYQNAKCIKCCTRARSVPKTGVNDTGGSESWWQWAGEFPTHLRHSHTMMMMMMMMVVVGDEKELVGRKGNLGETTNSAKSFLSSNQFLLVPYLLIREMFVWKEHISISPGVQ